MAGTALGPAILDRGVLASNQTRLAQAAVKLAEHVRGIAKPPAAEKPDHWHRRLLRLRGEGPGNGCRRAAEKLDELAALHSMISSAMEDRPGGTLRPSALAVLRLITNSNLVDCTAGRSAGF